MRFFYVPFLHLRVIYAKIYAMISIEELKRNIERVQLNIEKACELRGVRRDEVTLIPATKTQPIDRLREFYSLTGIGVFGENRVQEFAGKYTPEFKWQMIGQLQTNKVKQVIGKVELIHSLDRPSLAAELNKESAKLGIITNVLVEVNIAAEPDKGGLAPDTVADFVGSLAEYGSLSVKGLMSVLPNERVEKVLNAYYAKLERLYEEVKKQYRGIEILSAGMSGDYTTAIQYGANLLRVGSALFGPRA